MALFKLNPLSQAW